MTIKVIPPKKPVITLAPLITYTRAEVEFAVRFAENVVGPIYLAPPYRPHE